MGSVVSSLGCRYSSAGGGTRDPLNTPDGVFDYVLAVEKAYDVRIKALSDGVRDLENRFFAIEEACSALDMRISEMRNDQTNSAHP